MRSVLSVLLTVFFLTISSAGWANNLSVSSASLTGANFTNGTIKVQFDISWDNSWRSSTNYDAAWVFIKYSTDSGSTWSHATLKATTTSPLNDGLGWSAGSGTGLSITVPADKKGAFLYRSADGTDPLSASNIQFVWYYAGDGVSSAATVRVKVFAIEMVFIPTGSFDIGDGNATSESTYAFHVTDNTKLTIGTTLVQNIKVDVNTYDDNVIEGTAPSNGLGIDGDGGIDYSSPQDGVIDNASFPTGYNAFYIMKYEISQGQYADFLNTITSTQASSSNRYPNSNGSYRHTISGSHPNYSASRPDRACNYLSWVDLAAYADWSALRPFTELEFEKASRGTAAASYQEWAGGAYTGIIRAAAISGTSEDGTETITTSGANCAYYVTTYAYTGGDATGQSDVAPYPYTRGPLRCGIFAASSTNHTRLETGGSYYGVMELSGNLWERPVTVGNSTGRSFDGAHGDGALSATGNANDAPGTTSLQYWPGYSSGAVSGATGSGFRGGHWYLDATDARVSDRSDAANTNANRSYAFGGRVARTSP